MCCKQMHSMHGAGHDAHATPAAARADELLLDILKRRYALGEISREQFEEMKRTLGVADAEATAHAQHSRKE